MNKSKKRKYKHLSYEDRLIIQSGIYEELTLKEMADKIDCDPTTISKEVKNHRTMRIANQYTKANTCVRKKTCRRRNVCNIAHGFQCKIACKTCRNCNEKCNDYVKRECKMITRYPYVCDRCTERGICEDPHYHYNAKVAQKEYENTLRESREGICLSESELKGLDDLISPMIEAGHSLEMIYMNHQEQISVSSRTLYNYIEKGILAARNIDLRRRVRFRVRKKQEKHIPIESKMGHLYQDFMNDISDSPGQKIWEMDTVEGDKGGAVLMTLLLRGMNFMFIYRLEGKSSEGVIEVFDELERILGYERFKDIFEVILTDNGTEFSRIKEIEIGQEGYRRTKLYFCEPRQSQQKGALEKNHEYIRYIIAKGKSFDFLDEEKVKLMMNTINSVKRARLNKQSPNELIKEVITKEERERLGIKEIEQKEIVLRERLVR